MENTNLKDTWREVLSQIQLVISKAHFRAWFSKSNLIKIEENSVTIEVKNKIARDYFENDFKEVIQETLKKVLEKDLDLKIQINANLKDEEVKNDYLPLFKTSSLEIFEDKEEEYKKAIERLGINPKYTFENFIVGSSNRLAHAAAAAVAENPGHAYNPLFIYGNVGLGKTHLIQAISNQILKKDPSFKIMYSSSEVFLNEMVGAIRSGTSDQFRKKYREKNLLIIDDIQFIENKKGTQEEIFHTFNAMYQYNKQIVIVSDRTPNEMPYLEARLRSRFEGGMVVDINEPDYETRLAILQKKVEEKGYKIQEEILRLIAQKFTSNIRELEGILMKIGTLNSIGKEQIKTEEVMKILGDRVTKRSLRIKPNDVITAVCNNFNISMKEIKSPVRTERIAFTRQIAMFILRTELNLSFMEVARALNRKDHTTVIYAVEKIKNLQKSDEEIDFQIKELIKILKN